jgi:hypothetical protein
MIKQNWIKKLIQGREKIYFFLFLTAMVFTSKKIIIIYNEEILVAVTFFAFVFFIYNFFGHNIKESLDERCLTIQQEMETFFVLKKESLTQALQQHKDVSFLMENLTCLIKFTKQVLNNASQRSLVVLNNLFFHHIKQKLSTLYLSTTPPESDWNRQLAAYQLPLVLAFLESRENQAGYPHPHDQRMRMPIVVQGVNPEVFNRWYESPPGNPD